MTDELHEVMRLIASEHGSIEQLVRSAGSQEELTRRLVAFTGIGPVTAEIFLRELPASVLPR